MNLPRKLIAFAAVGLVSTSAMVAQARDNMWEDDGESAVSYAWATVIEARPIVETVRVRVPREECWQERVVYRDAWDGEGHSRRGGNGVGTVLGGVIGGAIGNAVGHEKRNKQVGTVVGAVVGATLGRAIEDSARRDRMRTSYTEYETGTEQVCRTYHDYREEQHVTGYRVRYRYNNETYSARMDADPGDTMKIRLAVTPAQY